MPEPKKPLDQMAPYEQQGYANDIIRYKLRSLQFALDDKQSVDSDKIIDIWKTKYSACDAKIHVELV